MGAAVDYAGFPVTLDIAHGAVIAGIGIAALDAAVTYGPWLLILAAPRPIAFGISSFVEAKWRCTLGGVPV